MKADPQRSAMDGSQAGDASAAPVVGDAEPPPPAADAPLRAVAPAIAATAYMPAYLRIVVLPVIVALLLNSGPIPWLDPNL